MRSQCKIDGCMSPVNGGGLCSKHYLRRRKYGTPEDRIGVHGSLEDKFYLSVIKSDGCWGWLGFARKGYGSVWHEGRNIRSNRASWIIHFGEIPDGMRVCHKCDNPSCTNPEHLFLGSDVDNVADRNRKRRDLSKNLNEHKVRSIRVDSRPSRAIASDYGISHNTVNRIKSRLSWPHVEDFP